MFLNHGFQIDAINCNLARQARPNDVPTQTLVFCSPTFIAGVLPPTPVMYFVHRTCKFLGIGLRLDVRHHCLLLQLVPLNFEPPVLLRSFGCCCLNQHGSSALYVVYQPPGPILHRVSHDKFVLKVDALLLSIEPAEFQLLIALLHPCQQQLHL
jgi:hypothetical protein